jgi:hypothetical protein
MKQRVNSKGDIRMSYYVIKCNDKYVLGIGNHIVSDSISMSYVRFNEDKTQAWKMPDRITAEQLIRIIRNDVPLGLRVVKVVTK